jgi:hypothetical protein
LKGSNGSKGGELYLWQATWIIYIAPDIVIMEQSGNATNINAGEDVKQLLRELEPHYVLHTNHLKTIFYGDGSSRIRFYVAGIHRRHKEKANHWKYPSYIYSIDRCPCAADFACLDEDVPPENWLHGPETRSGEPTFLYSDKHNDYVVGKLHHLGRYGQGSGPGDRTWPANLYSWFGPFNTQLTSNGGGRRPKLTWTPGEIIDITRSTTVLETCRIAGLSETYAPWVSTFDSSPEFLRYNVNMGVPQNTGYAIASQCNAFLTYLGVEKDISSETHRWKLQAQRATKEEINAQRGLHQNWQNEYSNVRSMLVDTGATGSLNYTDCEPALLHKETSKFSIGTAQAKTSISGRFDAKVSAMVLNTIQTNLCSKKTPLS